MGSWTNDELRQLVDMCTADQRSDDAEMPIGDAIRWFNADNGSWHQDGCQCHRCILARRAISRKEGVG